MATTQCLPLDAQNWNIFVREEEALEIAIGGRKKRKKKTERKLSYGRQLTTLSRCFSYVKKPHYFSLVFLAVVTPSGNHLKVVE